ncbi:MAG TPA: methyl-accepting chemotaxis protein [Bacteroidales bacterium]|nr:methyl-accepting chemotaxis protein [Bacteroidales bacterium]
MTALMGLIFLLSATIFYLVIKNKKLRTLSSEQNLQIVLLKKDLENTNDEVKKLLKEINKSGLYIRLVQQSPNAIMLMDKDANVIWTNKGFEQMYEYTYKEFIAARGGNYRKTSFHPAVHERLDKLARTKKPIKYEALNITRTGKELWTQTALMPILGDDDELIGMVTIDTDIHQRVVESDSVMEKMEDINKKMDEIFVYFKAMKKESRDLFESINNSKQWIEQTDEIVKFIKEISDKTKILGINASIEAHVAGSYGVGFRVISNEIVEISHQTTNSVAEISKILENIKKSHDGLLQNKHDTEKTMELYNEKMKDLKKEIIEVENAIQMFKTLT